MINKIDLRKAISSIAISNAKRNTIYKAFSDLDSITKEEFDSVKSDISKVVESMLTKDTVGKANGVASLDSDGNVPIEQLGNIDTTLFLIVRELPTTDIKSNKIYLVPNKDGQGNNVYIEYLYVEDVWEKVGEFKPEVDLSHIEEELDTKADKTDVDNRLNDLQNYCFKLGNEGQIQAPYRADIFDFNKKIQRLNSDEDYTYADITAQLHTNENQIYIYDKTVDVAIKVTKIKNEELSLGGDFFRTTEPLNLTHTFYLDNDKTGVVENLSMIDIEKTNTFINFPYIDTLDNIDDNVFPQYLYDADDKKWIEIVETYMIVTYDAFNTEKPLDLTHELYYSYYNLVDFPINAIGDYSVGIGHKSSISAKYSTVLGTEAFTNSDYTVAIGYKSGINTTNCYGSITIGIEANVVTGINSSNNYTGIAIGNKIKAGGNSIVLGYKNKIALESICIGNAIEGICNNSVIIGNNTIGNVNSVSIGNSSQATFRQSLSLGYSATTGGDYAIALGKNVSNTKSILGIGFNGVNGIDMDRDNYGLYLKGFGGYDGTNLVVKSGNTETLNPDIKSVQQIINEKADASAIPTKTSQLTNDSYYATTTPGGILAVAGLTVRNNAQIRYIQKTDGEKGTYLIAETSADRVANKVFAADGSLFDASKLVKTVQCNVSGDTNNIEFGYTTVDNTYNFAVVPTVTANHGGIMSPADKVKLDSLPSITSKLVNITTASTAEEVVTKFNALLADLKAKGYMEADTPQ